MRKNILRLLTVSAILISLGITAVSSSQANLKVASMDRVPIGDWPYSAMARLAADGLVPGFAARVFESDRLFDRFDMAHAVEIAVETSQGKALTPAETSLLGELVNEFRPELLTMKSPILNGWDAVSHTHSDIRGLVTGQAQGVIAHDSNTDSNVAITGFADVSGNTFAATSLSVDRTRFFHDSVDTENPDTAIIAGFGKNIGWSAGKQYFNWGPSYIGSLLLSDNSNSFLQAHISNDIDLGRWTGPFKLTQMMGTFHEDGSTIYLFARRYEKPLGNGWHAGINEMAKMNSAPNPSILVMPVYLYQHIDLADKDKHINALYSADLEYLASGGQKFYGELLVDDMSSPAIFGHRKYDRPQKTGWTAGFYLPKFIPSDHLSTIRAEYTVVDRLTYSATRESNPELAYTHDGDIIGSAIGPNSKALYLRAEQYLTPKISLIGEYLDLRQKDAGIPETPKKQIFSIQAMYDITPSKSVGFRVAPFAITKPGSSPEKSTLFELRAMLTY